MSNKTCGDCRFYAKETEHCKLKGICWKFATDTPCSGFTPRKPITNGDVIRQGGDYALAHFKSEHRCDVCAYAAPLDEAPACRRPEGKVCFDGMLAWLNAPADCVKQNGDDDTQADLCKAENTESGVGNV